MTTCPTTMSTILATQLDSLALSDRPSDTTQRVQQISHQLTHWRTLIARFPNDPFQAFWHDQCSTLESLLIRLQSVGQKRGRENDNDMGKRGCGSF